MKTAFAESFDSSRTAANGAAVLSLTLLAICGCQNMAVTKEDSSRNIAAETVSAPYTQAEAVSAVGGRYFPTDDGEATFDFCHPNDWGSMHMGRVYADAIRSILLSPTP